MLLSLTTLIVLETILGCKTKLNGQVNEIGEVGRIMTQEQCLLGQANVIKAIPNLTAPLLALNPYYLSQKYQKPIFHL